jgi:type VI secretion system lysozyme-like protein
MRSILDDSRLAAVGPLPLAHDPARALRETVGRHLRELCVTRRGSVLLCPAFGVADSARLFHEHPTSAGDMERDLLEVIARFEPRLQRASVTHLPSTELDLVLRFDVQGALVSEGRAFAVRFVVVIDSNHQVEVT